jgi:hypothetical protein
LWIDKRIYQDEGVGETMFFTMLLKGTAIQSSNKENVTATLPLWGWNKLLRDY